MPRRFLEIIPPPVVGFDLSGQFFDEAASAYPRHQFPQARGSNVVHHDLPPIQPIAPKAQSLVSEVTWPKKSQNTDQKAKVSGRIVSAYWHFVQIRGFPGGSMD